jgi:hypothetical protein
MLSTIYDCRRLAYLISRCLVNNRYYLVLLNKTVKKNLSLKLEY